MARRTLADRIPEIVTSQVFKAINLLIDEKAQELAMWQRWVIEDIERRVREGGQIDTRVSYEEGGREKGEVKLPFDSLRLSALQDTLASIHALEGEIEGLMKFKLQLLNDYDFTHGDPSIQRAIFGTLKAPVEQGA